MTTTIPAAHGPLPRIGTKAYGRFADRYENTGCHGFSREDDATVSAGWWPRHPRARRCHYPPQRQRTIRLLG